MTAPAEPIWVDTPERLAAAAGGLSAARRLWRSTPRADSFYTTSNKCCLIQVSAGTRPTDRSAGVEGGRAMRDLFHDARRAKILHAAEQDVLYLRRDFGLDLHPLFDTMIAGAAPGEEERRPGRAAARVFRGDPRQRLPA